MKTFKKWTDLFLLYLSGIVFAIFTLNLVVNPYNTFPFVYQGKLNHYKKRVLSDRMTKFYEVKHIQPKTILMGTSRIGLFPSEQLKPYAKNPVYNLSMASSSVEEQSLYLEYSIKNLTPETIIWALDFFAFNPDKPQNPSFDPERFKTAIYWPDITGSLFSFQVTGRSINTIKDSLHHSSTNDSQTYLYETMQYIHMQGQSFKPVRIQKKIKQTLGMYRNQTDYLKSEKFQDIDSLRTNLQYLRNIVSMCKAKGIKLIVYISPIHEKHLEQIYKMQLKDTYLSWKREVANITSYADFSIPNSITKDSNNFRDSSHVTSDVGPLIFARIFNKHPDTLPNDFGLFITQENIDAAIDKQMNLFSSD